VQGSINPPPTNPSASAFYDTRVCFSSMTLTTGVALTLTPVPFMTAGFTCRYEADFAYLCEFNSRAPATLVQGCFTASITAMFMTSSEDNNCYLTWQAVNQFAHNCTGTRVAISTETCRDYAWLSDTSEYTAAQIYRDPIPLHWSVQVLNSATNPPTCVVITKDRHTQIFSRYRRTSTPNNNPYGRRG